LSIGLGLVWGVMVAVMLVRLPERSSGLATLSLFYPVYYTIVSFVLDWRSRRGHGVTA
jgi:hypothetical protein